MIRQYLIPGTTVCLLYSSLGLCEQNGPVELQRIEVTASPYKQHSDLELAQPSDLLFGKKLMLRTKSTLGETLDQQMGVTASDFNPVGASRPVIRGLGGPRVKILENGQSAMDVSDISVDHAVTVEPILSRQIEVLKGPSTLMSGSGAIGGVVNVVNNRIPDQLPDGIEGAFEGRFNSASTERTGAFDVSGAVGNFALHGDGMYLATDDYHAAVGKIVNSAVEKGQWSAGGAYIGDQGWLGISVSQLYNNYQIPVEALETESPFIDMRQTRVNLKSRIEDPLPALNQIDFNFAWSDYGHTEFENPGEAGTVFKNKEFNLGLIAEHQPLWNMTGAFGLQGGSRDLNADGEEAFISNTKIWNIAGFIVEEFDLGDWHVELGARLEHKKYQPDRPQPDTEFNPYSLSAGAIWNFVENYNLSLNANRAQRAPQVQELYANGQHVATQTFEIGNPDLKIETSNNIDLSINKTEGRLKWSFGGFYNYYENFIYLQETDINADGLPDFVNDEGNLNTDGPFLLVFDRQRNAHFYGVEAEATHEFMNGNWGNLNGRLWGDFVRGEFDGGGNIPRMPPWRIGANLEYSKGSWASSLDVFYVGKQEQTATLETQTPGYTMLNINLTYEIPADPVDFTIYARGTNLLNEDARRATSFLKDVAPLPGRAAVIGIRGEF